MLTGNLHFDIPNYKFAVNSGLDTEGRVGHGSNREWEVVKMQRYKQKGKDLNGESFESNESLAPVERQSDALKIFSKEVWRKVLRISDRPYITLIEKY